MSIWVVIWVVLMMFWLFFGTWIMWEPAKPYVVGSTLIPWLCVLILGLIVFGAVSSNTVVIR